MIKPIWAVQTNLNSHTASLFDSACMKNGNEFIPFFSRAFSDEIPDNIPTENVLIYGSTRLVSLLEKSSKYNPGVVSITDDYLKKWDKDFLLNSDNVIQDISEVHLGNESLFIRPQGDNKEFDGAVYTKEEFEKIKNVIPTNLTVLVSSVKEIRNEWRLFIVNGKVSTGSHYRYGGKEVCAWPEYPPTAVFAAEHLCEAYLPAEIFVMDVCMTKEGDYKVVECNGFNSCGFYEASVDKFVKDVNTYYEKMDLLG